MRVKEQFEHSTTLMFGTKEDSALFNKMLHAVTANEQDTFQLALCSINKQISEHIPEIGQYLL
jgi:hypothetical protein